MRDSIIFEKTIRWEVTVKNFHLMLKTSCAKDKWKSFSEQTKENIFVYFWYLRNIQDSDYFTWSYWRTEMTAFVTKFDESNPKYDGNYEYVVLGHKPDPMRFYRILNVL